MTVALANEAARLMALRQLNLLDTSPSESFDRITRLAARLFDLPISAVSLTDGDRQWFKSRVGLDRCSAPRADAPCAEVVERGAAMVIPDVLAHPRYRHTGFAADGLRFYAGAPLVTEHGHGLGALCVLGREARACPAEDLAMLVDLAAMVMAQIELRYTSGRVDRVSGLPNRMQFFEDLEDLARDAGRADAVRYLVLVDIARGEQLNEAVRVMGPTYFDDIVTSAAQKIAGAIGPERRVYHVAPTQMAFLGGPAISQDAYVELLESVLLRLRGVGAQRFVTTTTIGVAPFRPGEVAPQDLLRRANSAAQDSRRLNARVCVYSPALDEGRRRRFGLINDFGVALAGRNELRLVYHPRIDVVSGACVGAEALLRWDHPMLGPVSPAEFIPLIEHTSLAHDTTAWVLDTALRQQAAWRAAGLDIVLSVNVSTSNLDEADLGERVLRALDRHGLTPSSIELEVTESAMMDDPDRALALLGDIAATGIALAIDDFGTGYSSLSYLQRLPARVVKIDQSFMRDLANDARAQALVRTMIDLSHALGYRVVAEGVEAEAVLGLLSELGCDEAQGFLFAEPMRADAFSTWLERRAIGCGLRAAA